MVVRLLLNKAFTVCKTYQFFTLEHNLEYYFLLNLKKLILTCFLAQLGLICDLSFVHSQHNCPCGHCKPLQGGAGNKRGSLRPLSINYRGFSPNGNFITVIFQTIPCIFALCKFLAISAIFGQKRVLIK